MAFTTAQLAAAITPSQTIFGLINVSTNQSGLPAVGAIPLSVGFPMLIDSEFMFVYAQPQAGTVQVRGRGTESAAVAHDILASVSCSASVVDFGNPQPGTTTLIDAAEDLPITIGSDQTITPNGAIAIYNINKLTAAAVILTAPTLADQGVMLTFTSNTPAAHVITATNLFMDGTGTLPHSTATFNAKQGATLTVVAENGFWNVVSNNFVTIS